MRNLYKPPTDPTRCDNVVVDNMTTFNDATVADIITTLDESAVADVGNLDAGADEPSGEILMSVIEETCVPLIPTNEIARPISVAPLDVLARREALDPAMYNAMRRLYTIRTPALPANNNIDFAGILQAWASYLSTRIGIVARILKDV